MPSGMSKFAKLEIAIAVATKAQFRCWNRFSDITNQGWFVCAKILLQCHLWKRAFFLAAFSGRFHGLVP